MPARPSMLVAVLAQATVEIGNGLGYGYLTGTGWAAQSDPENNG
jgi:hypothetical protein